MHAKSPQFPSPNDQAAKTEIPPGQHLVAADKWPLVGEVAPAESSVPWRVELAGAIEKPAVLDLAALAGFRQTRLVVDIHCVTRWTKPKVEFAGVLLSDLLDEVLPRPSAQYVSFVALSERGHSTSLTLADALALQTLIAVAADGKPLADEHGGPLRVVVPQRYFYKSLKWLWRIDLLGHDRLGYWEQQAGYHNHADPWREQRFVASNVSKQEVARLIATRNFAGLNLLGICAAEHDLRELDAAGSLLRNADFRRADLRGARFYGANLSNARFQGADLRHADLTQADLEGADFSAADLRGTDLTGASLFGATFCSAAGDCKAVLDRSTSIDDAALAQLTDAQAHFAKRRLSE